jgi:hypothetical protein
MLWKEKHQPTPFDALPIEGLVFAETSYEDADGRRAEYKSPLICFPSGLTYPLVPSRNPTHWGLVELFTGLRLPYRHTRDTAFVTAERGSGEYGYLVAVTGDAGLVVMGKHTVDCLIVTYDPSETRMVNVELLLPPVGKGVK